MPDACAAWFGYRVVMTTQEFLDAAIAQADAGGRFDAHKLSSRLKLTKAKLRLIGESLQKMNLILAPAGNWQLTGVARELARAMSAGNVDRRASFNRGPDPLMESEGSLVSRPRRR
jgi:hypothetical protein